MDASYDVFLSYYSREPVGEWVRESFAVELQNWLNEQFSDRVVSVFFDRQSIEVGEHIDARLIDALKATRVFVPVLSPSYFNLSKWCKWEWEAFHVMRPTGVMPVLYYNRKKLPLEVQSIKMEDFSQHNDVNKGWQSTPRYSDFRQKVREFAERIATRLTDLASQPTASLDSSALPPVPVVQGIPVISQQRMTP